jgi:hypothetical protein
MITFKDFFSKLKLGWMFVFASFTLWCDHMQNKSMFDFWTDGFYHCDNGPEELELTWQNYEIDMKHQKKPRGRGKLKYPNTMAGFLKWQEERKMLYLKQNKIPK